MFTSFRQKSQAFKQKKPRLAAGILACLIIFIIVGVLIIILPHTTLAETAAPATAAASAQDTGPNALFRFLGGVVLAIAAMIGKLLLVVIEQLVGIVKYNDFVNADAVKTGWGIIRDVCNMFFVIVLLVIAFGTILKIERYKYNQLLGKLVLMALLVNFSKTIAAFFIDFGQVIMMTFVNAFKDAAAGNFTTVLHLKEMLSSHLTVDQGPQNWEYLGATLLALALLMIALVVMLAMVVVFLARIVMLWILVVLSPLAYLLSVLPGQFQSYASQWWSNFGKWVAIGPVLAFFIWLSLTILTAPATSNFGVQVLDKGESGGAVVTGAGGTVLAGTVSTISKSENLLGFIISIAMLVAALMAAQQLGGVAGGAASWAMGKVKSLGSAPLKPIQWTSKKLGEGRKAAFTYGKEWLGAKTGVSMVADNWKKGWQQHREKTRQDRLTDMQAKAAGRGGVMQAIASPQDFFDNYWNIHGIKKVFKEGIAGGKGKKAAARVEDAEKGLGQVKEKEQQARDFATLPTEGEYAAEDARLNNTITQLNAGNDVEFDAVEVEPHIKVKMDQLGEEINQIQEEVVKTIQAKMSMLPEIQAQARLDQEIKSFNPRLRDITARLKGMTATDPDFARLDAEKTALEVQKKAKEDALSKSKTAPKSKEVIQLEKEETDANDRIRKRQRERSELGELTQQVAANPNDKVNLKASWTFADYMKDELSKKQRDLKEKHDKGELPADRQAQAGAKVYADTLKAQQKLLQEQLDVLKKDADARRPMVNYAMRRDQQQAIAHEKSTMLTDSWQELWSIYQDAKKQGDLTRASAALLKATEYANENEFQNMAGDSSDAQGLKSFIMNELVGTKGLKGKEREAFEKEHGIKISGEGMGMSQEQALNIGNLVSYQAEKVGHWMNARAVGVKNGKQYWQNEKDRTIEMTAEIRKQDPENFMRRVNRLGWGTEVGQGATREDRAKNFQTTGERQYNNSPFALGYLKENWKNFESLLSRNRFNPNIAINLTSNNNMPGLDKLIQEMGTTETVGKGDQKRNFGDMVHLIRDFGAAGESGDPFKDMKYFYDNMDKYK